MYRNKTKIYIQIELTAFTLYNLLYTLIKNMRLYMLGIQILNNYHYVIKRYVNSPPPLSLFILCVSLYINIHVHVIKLYI